jgi:hypothetical protein
MARDLIFELNAIKRTATRKDSRHGILALLAPDASRLERKLKLLCWRALTAPRLSRSLRGRGLGRNTGSDRMEPPVDKKMSSKSALFGASPAPRKAAAVAHFSEHHKK